MTSGSAMQTVYDALESAWTAGPVRLHYKRGGTGAPVLLLHGYPESGFSWRYQAGALLPHLRLLIPDLRGMGLSNKPAAVRAYTLREAAQDLIRLLDGEGIARAQLVGHDWGGAVAWTLAALHPDRVEQLIVLNMPHPDEMRRQLRRNLRQVLRSWYALAFQIPLLPEWLILSSPLRFFRTAFHRRGLRPDRFPESDLRRYAETFSRFRDVRGATNYYRAFVRHPAPPLPQVQTPVSMIWGERDFALGKELTFNTIRYCQEIPRIRYIPAASHWVQHEAAETVNAWLLEWLCGILPAGAQSMPEMRRDSLSLPKPLPVMSLRHIPVVDLNDYRSDDPARRARFVQQLGDSFSGIGFAIVSNHGVPPSLIGHTYESFKRFFALPDEVKRRYEISGLAGQRGYTSKGREHAKQSKVGDLKEFYHIGQTVRDGDPIRSEYPENVFPAEEPGVEEHGVALYQSLESAGRHLLRAIAEYLDLPVDYFDSKIHNGNSILRPIHYYGIEHPEEMPEGAVRAAEHEDINLITLLIGASAEGLQVRNAEGEWISANPEPDQIVINVGDMLQRLTNNRLRSTTHRVVNPPRESMHLPRYSMPFFLHPRSDMSLACLPSCTDAEHPRAYPDITAGEYLDERLREIGLKA